MEASKFAIKTMPPSIDSVVALRLVRNSVRTQGVLLIILGLNAFHGDSSAAILRDGVLIAAAEEERFRRVKHWAGFPSRAIAYCLAEAGVTLADVDHLAINQNNRANLIGKLRYLAAQRPGPA